MLFKSPRSNEIVVNYTNFRTSVWNLWRFDMPISARFHHQDTSMWSRLAEASRNVIKFQTLVLKLVQATTTLLRTLYEIQKNNLDLSFLGYVLPFWLRKQRISYVVHPVCSY